MAFAGPLVNIVLAVIFGLAIRFSGAALGPHLTDAFSAIVYVNLLLALFNMVPLPPLDGSKVLGGLFAAVSRGLARSYETFLINFQRIGLLPMILVILVVFNYILRPIFVPLMASIFGFLTGAPI